MLGWCVVRSGMFVTYDNMKIMMLDQEIKS